MQDTFREAIKFTYRLALEASELLILHLEVKFKSCLSFGNLKYVIFSLLEEIENCTEWIKDELICWC